MFSPGGEGGVKRVRESAGKTDVREVRRKGWTWRLGLADILLSGWSSQDFLELAQPRVDR